MSRDLRIVDRLLIFLLLSLAGSSLAGLTGCSSPPPKKEAVAPDKIQGVALIALTETSALDDSMNAGGSSMYLVQGLNRYRLFLNKPFTIEPSNEYVVEGVIAQKAIDAIGDPAKGKNGYPLASSCNSVVKMAWPGLAMDLTDSYAKSVRDRVRRYPGRPVFLVTKIELATAPSDAAKQKNEDAGKKQASDVTTPAEKQSALLIEGPTVLPAPLWEPAGGTAKCKVIIDEDGKIAALNSGAQLCEIVPWSQFRYKPTLKSGQPVRVNTEVEVRFDPSK